MTATLPPPRYDRLEPCAQCPYRTDAAVAKWHHDHFVDLLANDEDLFGRVYACHNKDGNICVGWALDQRDRDTPSNALRLTLRLRPELVNQYEAITDGGHERYPSILAMCQANYPQVFGRGTKRRGR